MPSRGSAGQGALPLATGPAGARDPPPARRSRPRRASARRRRDGGVPVIADSAHAGRPAPAATPAGRRSHALVAPASPFHADEFDARRRRTARARLRTGLRRARVRRGTATSPGLPQSRVRGARRRVARSVDSRRSIAVRGGYGSAQLLPLLDPTLAAPTIRKLFIGYSDITSLLSWQSTHGSVAFHGPMIDGRLARGPAGYDRESFLRGGDRSPGRWARWRRRARGPSRRARRRHAGRRHADASWPRSRHAVRVRSAERRAVSRGRRRAPVPDRPDADAAAPGRDVRARHRRRLRRASPAATRPAATRRPGPCCATCLRSSRARCCSGFPRAIPRADVTLPFGVDVRRDDSRRRRRCHRRGSCCLACRSSLDRRVRHRDGDARRAAQSTGYDVAGRTRTSIRR